MTAPLAMTSTPDPAAYHDPHHPKYGFHTEKWHDMPRPTNGPDWFPDEERYRREAKAHAYRQHGTPQNWFRYLTLGYFVYDDCAKFDALWMKYSADPIICHRMVLYNFLYHIDRKLDLSETLHAWATEVSQPYLQRYAPQYLAINTIDHTWNDHVRGDHDVMDIESNQWMTVGSTKKKTLRSKSPPTNLPNKQRAEAVKDTTSGANVIEHSTFDETSTVGKQSALQPDLNVPVNDGTYRLTFRWNPKRDFTCYNKQSTTWLNDVHAMLCDLFPSDDCFFYRWESTDLQMSTEITKLSPGEL